MIWLEMILAKALANPWVTLGVASFLCLFFAALVYTKLAEIIDFNTKKQRAIEELIQRYEHIHSHP
ncbi:MAG: hypothetical protein QNL04_02890 [SAR324 cluster bacterium]|nr:hypothetical protein [SAR324 cluster bacterium]